MSKMADTLRAARLKKGWGLRETARNAGIPAATISKLENGELENPTFATLVALRNALGIKDKDFVALFD